MYSLEFSAWTSHKENLDTEEPTEYFSKKQLVDLYQIFRAFQYQNIFLVTLGLFYNYNEIDPIG